MQVNFAYNFVYCRKNFLTHILIKHEERTQFSFRSMFKALKKHRTLTKTLRIFRNELFIFLVSDIQITIIPSNVHNKIKDSEIHPCPNPLLTSNILSICNVTLWVTELNSHRCDKDT